MLFRSRENTLLRRLFGFEHSLRFSSSRFPDRFLSSVTTKLHVLSPILRLSLLVPSTLIFGTILYVIMFSMALFLLPGYLLQICLLIFLQNPSLFLLSLVIGMFLGFLSLLLYLNFPFSIFSFGLSVLMGVC